MTEEIREKIRLEDGRHAERVTRTVSEGREDTEVVETWTEPKKKLRLAQRQIVHRRPCVYKRETETLNEETGEVLSREVEDVDQPKFQVEKIVSSASLPKKQDSGYVSREELREDIKDAIVALAKTMGSEDVVEEEPLSVQSVVEERLEGEKKESVSQASLVLLAIIAAEVGGLVWILFIL